ncbi:MAG: hypothetical protein RLZZ330_227 [Actinomycetota bacterium]|jgi:hypothetical protein
MQHKIFEMSFASVYPLYVKKAERKGRTAKEVDQVVMWLTGFDSKALKKHINDESTFREFFKAAKLNKNANQITGSICGVKIAEIEDPLMKKIRYMDKLVDELAQGKAMEKILRGSETSTMSNCLVTRGEVDLNRYEKLDGEWRKLGLAAPARRALVGARLLKPADLKKISLDELAALHGIGKNAIAILKKYTKASK